MARLLVVTIDTEVDKGPQWRIGNPVRFRSVVDGVPGMFSPLFERYGVRPTYFLSPEVIENSASVSVLRKLGDSAELATHLHAEFVEPHRVLFPNNMAGKAADAIQRQYPRAVEASKLANLTKLFQDAFGWAPTAFRAGRYGISDHTHELLAGLGYRVDSSVTPGVCWDYAEGVVDFRAWRPAPRWMETASGKLLELPISIQPRGRLGKVIAKRFPRVQRFVTRIAGARAFAWLRPSWSSGRELISYVNHSDEQVLVLMLHSVEVIAGASPYALSELSAKRVVDSMDELFAYCKARGVRFCTASEASEHV